MIAGNFHTVKPNAAIIPVGRIVNRKTGEVTHLIVLDSTVKQFEHHQKTRVHRTRLFAFSNKEIVQSKNEVKHGLPENS
jgi:hypothetical protein